MKRFIHQFYFLKDKELDRFYFAIFLRFFALRSVYVFLPVYLLLAGFTISKIFLFYLILRTFHLAFIIVSRKLFVKYGQNFLIILSLPILLFFYLGLKTIAPENSLFWFLAIVYGISNAFFWFGYHIDLAEFSHQKGIGRETAFSNILISFSGVLAPIVSGFLIDRFGFPTLFSLVVLILLFASIFAFSLKKFEKKDMPHWKEIFQTKHIPNFIIFLGYGLEESILQVVWPLFAFIILKEFSLLGIAATLSSLLAIVFYWLTGSFFDRKNLKVLKMASFVNFLIWPLKSLAFKPMQVFLLDSFHGLARGGIYVPFDAITYLEAKKHGYSIYIFFREISINLGFMLSYFMLYLSKPSLTTALLLAGFSSLVYFFLKLNNETK